METALTKRDIPLPIDQNKHQDLLAEISPTMIIPTPAGKDRLAIAGIGGIVDGKYQVIRTEDFIIKVENALAASPMSLKNFLIQ